MVGHRFEGGHLGHITPNVSRIIDGIPQCRERHPHPRHGNPTGWTRPHRSVELGADHGSRIRREDPNIEFLPEPPRQSASSAECGTGVFTLGRGSCWNPDDSVPWHRPHRDSLTLGATQADGPLQTCHPAFTPPLQQMFHVKQHHPSLRSDKDRIGRQQVRGKGQGFE